jgi:uridylate kinase
MDRSAADYIGMMGTVMNAMVVEQVLENMCDVRTRVLTSIEINKVAEPYIRKRALRHMEKGRVVIFGGGTGSPYFTTDTTAALRACEIHADAILMAKNGVDGVYDSDPKTNPDAKKYDELTYSEILTKGLKVMDSTAAAMCADNKIDLVVFDMNENGNIVKAAEGLAECTIVKAK